MLKGVDTESGCLGGSENRLPVLHGHWIKMSELANAVDVNYVTSRSLFRYFASPSEQHNINATGDPLPKSWDGLLHVLPGEVYQKSDEMIKLPLFSTRRFLSADRDVLLTAQDDNTRYLCYRHLEDGRGL